MPKHTACPKCGSKDNLARWSDGHAYCFTPGCGYREGHDQPNYTPPYDTYELPSGLPPRGLTYDACQIYGVRWTYRRDRKTGETRPYLAYTYYDKHVSPIMTKYRAGGLVLGDGARDIFADRENIKEFYGTHVQRRSKKTVFICEGETDCIAVAQTLGYRYTVLGVPGAQTFKHCHQNNPEIIDRADTIILVPQSDGAGSFLVSDVMDVIPNYKIKVATLDRKDACEYTMTGDSPALYQCLLSAESVAPDIIMSGENLVDEVSQYLGLTDGSGMGLTTGFSGLDVLMSGWRPNSITLLAAQTKHGKSTLCCQLAYTYAALHGNVLFLSLELSVAETAITFTQVHYDTRILGEQVHVDVSQYSQFLSSLAERVKIVKHTGYISPQELETIVSRSVKEYDIKLLVVDHLTIGATSYETGQDNKTIDVLCMKLKDLVNRYNLACLAAVQVNEVRGEWLTQHDIRGSAVQKQIASCVLAIKRYHQTRQSCIYSLTPNRYSGKEGKVILDFGNGRYLGESQHAQ